MEKAKTKPNWVRGSCIGRGSFGTVSRAVDKSDGGVFAVKSVCLGPGSEARAEALENEIRILRRLSSPWVVGYLGHDVTVEDGAVEPFRNLHLEYLPGGTAADLAADADDEGIVRSLTWCVASALSYVHSLGIVHCDVKGRNVLLGPARYAAKLSDFGTAAESAAAAPRGSPLWMAPEVIRGEYQGPESDVWSLGCTVIEMVTGKPGWEDRGADTLCRIGYSDELPELPTRLSELGLDFLDKCLRRDRTERWSCDQLLRHPFISSSAVQIMDSHQSPRCVLDWLDTKFCEDDDDEEEDDKFSELPTQSVRDRIGKLASTTGVNWESDGWIEVRNVISEKAPEVSEARCCRGGDEEGTSSEFSIFSRTEGEMEGTIGEYSDWKEIERTNLEYFEFGGGGIEEAVVVDGGRRWRGSEADPEHRDAEEPAAGEDEDTGAQVAPIVKLEEVAVTTGEEDEDAILDLKAKLYRFDKDGNQWKERGAGTVKLLKHKVTGKVRLVMRQSKTLKICANHLVIATMSVQEHAGNEKSCVWHAADFADGELKDELFCIRFGSVENCKTFMESFQEVAESQQKKEENKDASAAAGLLEKLSVEDEKTEDKASEEVTVAAKEKESESEPVKVDAEKKGETSAPST
ncbi:hypothetical protein RHMOL_Rhmol13G0083100 [Rhododendron molle]|uniref:Uncharacterized protein n=2 Tax=Rhododendron molle TaxID=49168 RepID=A0ACC0L4K1_RHOML|nr:hypothetical protein RHMOL_Rhmol13G0083100 [Rhododendron molle]KAI8523551.1 hypothetical protein RHMOL_Rhmol13G0083100 [Rhododendron molle]